MGDVAEMAVFGVVRGVFERGSVWAGGVSVRCCAKQCSLRLGQERGRVSDLEGWERGGVSGRKDFIKRGSSLASLARYGGGAGRG